MRSDSISSASHNIFAFRFTGSDGTTHDGSEDDGEHGAGRLLLKALIDNDVKIHWWSFHDGTATKSDLDASNILMKSG